MAIPHAKKIALAKHGLELAKFDQPLATLMPLVICGPYRFFPLSPHHPHGPHHPLARALPSSAYRYRTFLPPPMLAAATGKKARLGFIATIASLLSAVARSHHPPMFAATAGKECLGFVAIWSSVSAGKMGDERSGGGHLGRRSDQSGGDTMVTGEGTIAREARRRMTIEEDEASEERICCRHRHMLSVVTIFVRQRG
uniref:Uncharacterized protein n=1 Tax=Oryza nivara TaxID=4536 RepID=A0A0E0FLE2_ORYNI